MLASFHVYTALYSLTVAHWTKALSPEEFNILSVLITFMRCALPHLFYLKAKGISLLPHELSADLS